MIIFYPLPLNIDIQNIIVNTKVDYGCANLFVMNQKEKNWVSLLSEVFEKDSLKKYVDKGPLILKVTGN